MSYKNFATNYIIIKTAYLQPRSQGSLLLVPRSERERDPGKRWSRVSQNLGDDKR